MEKSDNIHKNNFKFNHLKKYYKSFKVTNDQHVVNFQIIENFKNSKRLKKNLKNNIKLKVKQKNLSMEYGLDRRKSEIRIEKSNFTTFFGEYKTEKKSKLSEYLKMELDSICHSNNKVNQIRVKDFIINQNHKSKTQNLKKSSHFFKNERHYFNEQTKETLEEFSNESNLHINSSFMSESVNKISYEEDLKILQNYQANTELNQISDKMLNFDSFDNKVFFNNLTHKMKKNFSIDKLNLNSNNCDKSFLKETSYCNSLKNLDQLNQKEKCIYSNFKYAGNLLNCDDKTINMKTKKVQQDFRSSNSSFDSFNNK